MICVGIDISKDKSTICILKPYGEVGRKPFEITHTEIEINQFIEEFFLFQEELRIVMEATGAYYLPVLLKFEYCSDIGQNSS